MKGHPVGIHHGLVQTYTHPSKDHTDLLGREMDASGGDSIVHVVADVSATAVIVRNEIPDKLSYKAVDTLIKTMYSDTNTIRSTALDILAIYLKGQKILYTEAKTFCERRLIALMAPAIFISCLTTLLSVQLTDVPYGSTAVSVLNGLNTFILALVSYLKLDAMAESHKIAAYKYDKLQAFCEFKSGKILFLNDEKDDVTTIIDQIETQVKEIKETNQFILPETIRHMFRRTYSQNVFARVKEIQTTETQLINELKAIINALLNLHAAAKPNLDKIQEVEDSQTEKIKEIIQLRVDFLHLDRVFEEEVLESIRRARRRCGCARWLSY